MRLPKPQTVAYYAFTSGDDIPERDPRSWVLEGSADGQTWVEADRRELDQPFENRRQTKTFAVAHPAAFRFYRFTFAPRPIGTFQVAEITLAGVAYPLSTVAGTGYRRDLNLMEGVAHTEYQLNGVTFRRDLLDSKPDEVHRAGPAGRPTGRPHLTAALQREHDAATARRRRRVRPRRPTALQQPGGGGQGIRYVALLGASVYGRQGYPGKSGPVQ
jgi:hypothetical protein